MIDDYSRECLGSLVDVSIGGRRVASFLDGLVNGRCRPEAIVCDNEPEFTCKGCSSGRGRLG